MHTSIGHGRYEARGPEVLAATRTALHATLLRSGSVALPTARIRPLTTANLGLVVRELIELGAVTLEPTLGGHGPTIVRVTERGRRLLESGG